MLSRRKPQNENVLEAPRNLGETIDNLLSAESTGRVRLPRFLRLRDTREAARESNVRTGIRFGFGTVWVPVAGPV